jgi:two-component system response regulator LytT
MNMISVIIIEDESAAVELLQLALKNIDANIVVQKVLSGVDDAIDWITRNSSPDLAFVDIQLEDGLSFEIFRKTAVNFPVIFTTAYDQYAIEAFKTIGIDYILKPVKVTDVQRSITKYKTLRDTWRLSYVEKLATTLQNFQQECTLLVELRDRIIPVKESAFAFFYFENGMVRGCTMNNQTYILNHTMESLFEVVNRIRFFRANRQYIVARDAIGEAAYYFNGRLAIKLIPPATERVLISKARVKVFKDWLVNKRVPTSD